jgi:hypothetical protein
MALSDLWNLLPTHREVNQRRKRDRLPAASTLFRAQSRIIGWWPEGYLDGRGGRLLEPPNIQPAFKNE